MDHGSFALLIPIFSVIGVFTMIIVLRNFENKERMAMIDKGEDPEKFMVKGNKSGVLVFAGLMIGAGIGLLIASFLDRFLGMEEEAYFSMILICGGLGLIAGRKMANSADQE